MNGKCFACKNLCVLTEEHVIPQALGGRLKESLYCKDCNESFGKGIDSEIAKQFGHIATILKIQRERGNPQPFGVVGIPKGINLVFDGETLSRKDPIVKIERESDRKKLKYADITARTQNELKKIQSSLEEKYEVTGESKTLQELHPGPTDTYYETTIDNPLIRRAVTKIAYSFLCVKIREKAFSSAFEEVRAYIKYGHGTDMACANFVHTQFMTDYSRPLHKTHICLNRKHKMVVGYVSLFGLFRFTVLLSGSFISQLEWPGLDYTFDPVRRQEIFGRDCFRAPTITKENILHPKQSQEFVQNELSKGYKVIDSYVDNSEFLHCEFSPPTT
ncbi:MAG: HNH endonuclease [Nitrospirales bacterium]|nr:HNH endonuclease [Nitrospirales bacterium]